MIPSREVVVATAIELADREGLRAASIRRIALELNARPMSLYTAIESKRVLLGLMRDAAVAETLLDTVPSDWQEALGLVARRNRAMIRRHPWMLSTELTRCPLGPSAHAHAQQAARAVLGFSPDVALRASLALAVDAFTFGHLTAELRARGDTSLGAGDTPDAGQSDRSFDTGLEWLLAGAKAGRMAPAGLER